MNFFFLARRFVAGETLEPAIEVIRQLNHNGIRATLNVLGEHVHNPQMAEQAVQDYMVTLDHIQQSGVDATISIKPSQLGLTRDPEFCFENLSRILERAEQTGHFVRLDMEGWSCLQGTLDLFFRLHQRYQNLGVVIQAYLYRSAENIQRLNQHHARVRLCKGAYKESPRIALQKRAEIRTNYMKLAEMLLQNGTCPAFATHDDTLIEAIKALADQRGISPEQFEFQMLYGMRPKRQEELVRQGYNMRVYVPFGSAWFPYFYRRLRERKENIWFVLATLFKR